MKTETKDIFELLGIPNLPKTSETFKEMNDLDSLAKMHFGYKSVYQSIRKDCVAKIEELNLKIATADRLIEMTAALEVLLKKDKPAKKDSNWRSRIYKHPRKTDYITKKIVTLFTNRAGKNTHNLHLIQITNTQATKELNKTGTYLFNRYKKYKVPIEKVLPIRGKDVYWKLTEEGVGLAQQIIKDNPPEEKGSDLQKYVMSSKSDLQKYVMSPKSEFLLSQIAKKNAENLEAIRVNVKELAEISVAAKKTAKENSAIYIYNWIAGPRYIDRAEISGMYKLNSKGIEAIESLNNE